MTTSSPPRGAARRELMLDAVLKVVAEEGVAAVTHRRVAEVAGVPLAATTYWFTSKEDLISTALGVASERDIARIRETAEEFTVGPGDDVAGLIAGVLLDDLADGRTMLMASYVLMIEARHRPALREISEDWGAAYFEALVSILGKAGAVDPEPDARLVLATLDGLLLNHLTRDAAVHAEDLVALLRTQVELLLTRPSVQ